MFFRPRRPTSLSLENICRPDFSLEDYPGHQFRVLRQTQSFSADLRTWTHQDDQCSDRESLLTRSERGSLEQWSYEEEERTTSRPNSLQSRRSSDFDYFSDTSFTDCRETVDACVFTDNGKIGPDIITQKPRQYPRPKFKSPTTIDHSFSKGSKKEVSCVDYSFSKDSKPKKTTNQDFTYNRSISRNPTSNDYTFGDQAKKKSTKKDFSFCKETVSKPPTKYNYNYSQYAKPKQTTKYDYRYNWQPSQQPTKYNYSYYRGFKLPTTRYDYRYNWVK